MGLAVRTKSISRNMDTIQRVVTGSESAAQKTYCLNTKWPDGEAERGIIGKRRLPTLHGGNCLCSLSTNFFCLPRYQQHGERKNAIFISFLVHCPGVKPLV